MKIEKLLFPAFVFPCLLSCAGPGDISSDNVMETSSASAISLASSVDTTEQSAMTESYDSTVGVEAKYEFLNCKQSANTDWDFDYFHLRLNKGCTGKMQWKSRLGGVVMEEKTWEFTYSIGYHLCIGYGYSDYIILPAPRPCLDPFGFTQGSISEQYIMFYDGPDGLVVGEGGEAYKLSITFSIF